MEALKAEPQGPIPSREDLLKLCQCHRCPLRGHYNPVLGEGAPDAQIAFVGEAPGQQESAIGRPFVGPAGRLLDQVLCESGLRREDVFVTNAALCHPPRDSGGDVPPLPEAISACRPRLQAELSSRPTRVVLAMGNSAASSLLRTNEKITNLVGATMRSDLTSAVVLPTFHPASVLHGAGEAALSAILGCVQRAAQLAQGVVPMPKADSQIAFSLCKTRAEVTTALFEMSSAQVLAVDVEADSFRYLTERLLMVQISDGERTWVLNPAALKKSPNLELFRNLLLSPQMTWVLHNMSFDFQFLRQHFRAVPRIATDTMAYALALNERAQNVGLKILSRSWLSEPYYEEELARYLPNRKAKFSSVPMPVLARYGARDARNTARLYPLLKDAVTRDGPQTVKLVEELLVPAQRCFADLEYRGVKLDINWARELESLWLPRVNAAAQAIQQYGKQCGLLHDINPRSPQQLAVLLYDVLGYKQPRGKYGKAAKLRTTGEEFTGKWNGTEVVGGAYPDEPISKLLRDFRTLDHLLRTYVYGIVDDVWPDGRVHPDFLLHGTATGRLAIHDPPLQIIPHHGVNPELSRLLRRLFVPSEDMVWIDADYRQLELRIAWHYSGDEELGEALSEGDFHATTAATILDKPLDQVTKQDRFKSKFVSFGIGYGRQAQSLARGELNCAVPEAQAYLDRFWSRYRKWYQWREQLVADTLQTGYATTTLGRRRHWNLITRANLQTIKNEIYNFPVQSLASDVCLLALVKLNQELPKRGWGFPLFSVHDSISFEVKREHLDDALKLIRDTMETSPFPTCASFPVEIAVGENWGDVEEVEAP